MNVNDKIEININPKPLAIPVTIVKKTKDISLELLTEVLNLIIDTAPTKPKALAKLFPITIIALQIITFRNIRECSMSLWSGSFLL